MQFRLYLHLSLERAFHFDPLSHGLALIGAAILSVEVMLADVGGVPKRLVNELDVKGLAVTLGSPAPVQVTDNILNTHWPSFAVACEIQREELSNNLRLRLVDF